MLCVRLWYTFVISSFCFGVRWIPSENDLWHDILSENMARDEHKWSVSFFLDGFTIKNDYEFRSPLSISSQGMDINLSIFWEKGKNANWLLEWIHPSETNDSRTLSSLHLIHDQILHFSALMTTSVSFINYSTQWMTYKPLCYFPWHSMQQVHNPQE